jgi:3-oxoacyl-[acyl-carrier-protein] synthase II
MKRVAITGLGPVSSIGIGKDAFWKKAQAGSGYFRNTDFDDVELAQYKSRVCSPIDGFDPADHLEDTRKLKRSARATKFSVVGTYLALRDAGLDPEPCRSAKGTNGYRLAGIENLRAGAIIGQSMSNTDIVIPNHTIFIQQRGPRRISRVTLPETNVNAGGSTVAEWFSLKGTNFTVSTACSSGTHAIGIAAMSIMNGTDDLIVTGGAEAPIDSYFFSGFDIINALSRRNDDPGGASRPFDRDRDGFVLGEGAGILILEEMRHAERRGARIYGEVLGFGFSSDAYNIVAPDPRGTAAINALRKALAMAKVSPREVEYINAHGTSTELNDPNETYIIKQVFGDYAYKVPISSSKSYFGHTIGAAGGLESIVTLLTISEGVITPTINLENPDTGYVDRVTPELDKACDLDYVPGVKRERSVGRALTQTFGFGGQNAAVLFGSYGGA